jgi:hypothetical protein
MVPKFYPGVKWSELDADSSPLSSTEVQERVELCIHLLLLYVFVACARKPLPFYIKRFVE